MPTGYTSKLHDGPQSFRDFALTCARNFGALIEMRDHDLDAPIPDEFKPDDYHAAQIDEAKAKLAKLEAMTPNDVQRLADEEYEQAVVSRAKAMRESAERRARYESALRAARAWAPPTPEHVNLRKFMIEQIEESIRFDCHADWPQPERKSDRAWFAEQVAEAHKDIAYHVRKHAEAEERAAMRTRWVRALRESLPTE